MQVIPGLDPTQTNLAGHFKIKLEQMMVQAHNGKNQ